MSQQANGRALADASAVARIRGPSPLVEYAPAPEAVKVEIKPRYGHFIGGRFVEPKGEGATARSQGATKVEKSGSHASLYFPTINPANEKVLSEVAQGSGAAGDKGYRTMPLAGIWATAPFLHNQAIGGWTAPEASPWERGDGYRAAMLELLSATRTPKVFVMPVAFGPIPAGTPLHYIFSKNQATGELLCDDLVENRGHTYGSVLSARDKDALIYWLQFQ